MQIIHGLPDNFEWHFYLPLAIGQYDMSTLALLLQKISNISRTLVGNEIVDNSDVVGASPVGAAPTTSSFST